jgi:hypothetical protein
MSSSRTDFSGGGSVRLGVAWYGITSRFSLGIVAKTRSTKATGSWRECPDAAGALGFPTVGLEVTPSSAAASVFPPLFGAPAMGD